jgi:hypothetical protein
MATRHRSGISNIHISHNVIEAEAGPAYEFSCRGVNVCIARRQIASDRKRPLRPADGLSWPGWLVWCSPIPGMAQLAVIKGAFRGSDGLLSLSLKMHTVT